MTIPITASDFKTYFPKDFVYDSDSGSTPGTISTFDITKAINEADLFINKRIIPAKLLPTAYYYLSAHFLVINYRNAFAGVQSVGEDIIQNNNITEVSESYAIPKRFVDNAVINAYARTGYGRKYLSIVLPNLIGNVGSISSNNGGNANIIGENKFGF